MARGMHAEVDTIPGAEIFSSLIGTTCRTQLFCKEGKECCGLINHYQKEAEKKLNLTN